MSTRHCFLGVAIAGAPLTFKASHAIYQNTPKCDERNAPGVNTLRTIDLFRHGHII